MIREGLFMFFLLAYDVGEDLFACEGRVSASRLCRRGAQRSAKLHKGRTSVEEDGEVGRGRASVERKF